MRDEKTIFQIVLELRDLKVCKVNIEYSGSGDSGGIDNFSYLDENGDEIEGIEGTHAELHNQLENYIYNILQDVEDWYNNEGGYGTVTLDLINNSFKIDNNIYYMETENYKHEGDLIKE